MSLAGWASHFRELHSLLESSERHYGTANAQFSDNMIERFELAIHSCSSIIASLDSSGQTIFDLKNSLNELTEYMRSLLDKWKEYRDILDSNLFDSSYRAPVLHTGKLCYMRFYDN